METLEERKARRKAAAKERRQELKKLLTEYKTATPERVAEVEQAAGLACGFSQHNRVLLGLQAFARGMVLGKVQAASKWSEQGRKVRKGQHALQVLAPIFPRAEVENEVDGGTEIIVDDSGKPSWFKAVPVFDISQTEPMTEQDRARAARKTERTAPAPVQRETVKSAPESHREAVEAGFKKYATPEQEKELMAGLAETAGEMEPAGDLFAWREEVKQTARRAVETGRPAACLGGRVIFARV